MNRFAGRRALVTGASRGIGAGIAERLAAEGADLVLTARTLEENSGHRLPGSLRTTAARLAKYGTRVEVLAADLTDPTARAEVVPEAVELLGGDLDILVNNAAAAIYQPMADFPLRRRMLSFEANVHAPLDLMQAVIPAMRRRGAGWIVSLSSGTTRIFPGPPFELVEPGSVMGIYGASKAALNRITNALGAELYGTGIRVNAVQPKAAVLSEGAAHLVGQTLRPDQIEALEEMVEAVTALCDCPPDLTGRICVSLELNRELDLTVRALDGGAWNRSEVLA